LNWESRKVPEGGPKVFGPTFIFGDGGDWVFFDRTYRKTTIYREKHL